MALYLLYGQENSQGFSFLYCIFGFMLNQNHQMYIYQFNNPFSFNSVKNLKLERRECSFTHMRCMYTPHKQEPPCILVTMAMTSKHMIQYM